MGRGRLRFTAGLPGPFRERARRRAGRPLERRGRRVGRIPQKAQATGAGGYMYNAIAENRSVTASRLPRADKNPRRRSGISRAAPAPSTRAPRGTRPPSGASSASPPQIVDDHEHHAAGNFVFTRGADPFVVDPSNYGELRRRSRPTPSTADRRTSQGDYGPSQTPWSEAELTWARATTDAVYAARSDFAKAFIFACTPSPIPYAHREWVVLPEGEIVLVDRAALSTTDALHVRRPARQHRRRSSPSTAASPPARWAAPPSPSTRSSSPAARPPSPSPRCGNCRPSQLQRRLWRLRRRPLPRRPVRVKIPGPLGGRRPRHRRPRQRRGPAVVGSMNDAVVDPAPSRTAPSSAPP